jgi:hypothetical protein
MAKPWPVRVSTMGLMVDENTPAPDIQHDATDDAPPHSTNSPSKHRSYSDFVAPGASSSSGPSRLRTAPGPSRPQLQRSLTQTKSQQSYRLVTDGVDDKFSYVETDVIYGKVNSLSPSSVDLQAPAIPPPSLPLPADVGDWFGVPMATSLACPDWQRVPTLELYGRPRSLSSSGSYVPSLLEATRLDLCTPPTPEEHIASPLQLPAHNIVGSNFDPNIHSDKFWFIQGASSNHQFVAEPLRVTEVVEPSTENEILIVAQVLIPLRIN